MNNPIDFRGATAFDFCWYLTNQDDVPNVKLTSIKNNHISNISDINMKFCSQLRARTSIYQTV